MQKPAGPLDPINMQDLGTYGVVAQCFEFLTTLGDSEMSPGIGPGLAESWEPNEDGSVWTFNLRQGVTWHDGTDFTSADVAATMDRLATAKNAGLQGRHRSRLGGLIRSDQGRVHTPRAERQPPLSRLGLQRAVGHHAGRVRDRLDARRRRRTAPAPSYSKSFEPATGAEYERNPDWWGGTTPLDGSVWSFFDDEGRW